MTATPAPRALRILTATLFCTIPLAGCEAVRALETLPERDRDGRDDLVGPSSPSPALRDPLVTIVRAEVRGDDGGGVLQVLLREGEATTRSRAALALGRLDVHPHAAGVTRPLVRALDDDEPQVRAAAAFALGQRADPAAVDALLAHWSDPDPVVRARIVEAAGRIDDPRAREEVLYALDDDDASVRAAAATATHTWPADDARAAVVDTALVQALGSAGTLGRDPEVVWHVLFALSRRRAERGRASFIEHARDVDTRARLFALRGLARLEVAGSQAERLATRDALTNATGDVDWRVALEAVQGLRAWPEAGVLDVLTRTALHRSAHVRRATADALGAFNSAALSLRERAGEVLDGLDADESAMVRARAVEARGELARDACAPLLAQRLGQAENEPLLRVGVARAAMHLDWEHALPLLELLAHDPVAQVRWEAVTAMAPFAQQAREHLHDLLAADDNGLRLAAIVALREAPDASDLEPLSRALRTSRGEIGAEVAFNALENAALVQGDRAAALLREGQEHPDAFVRRTATRLLRAREPGASEPGANAPPIAAVDAADPQPNAELDELARPSPGRNPRVDVSTTRGVMSFELFPDEAPRHVANFLELARNDYYDGLTFHRIVGDYVIQGGDRRGDGNGAVTADGTPLRREFTPRAYLRGALGMPRNEDPDSGGSQIFVTQRATPHLDGNYTLFGQLVEGFEVLDALELGDRILDVRERPRPR